MGGAITESANLKQAYNDANPLLHDLSILNSATMLVGDADAIVPYKMAAHPQANNVLLKGVGHFDWIHPSSDSFKRLVNSLDVIANYE